MIPTFATFHTKPSWHNRAGRTDRSACVEIKASDLWRRIPERDWEKRSLRDTGCSRNEEGRWDASWVEPGLARERRGPRLLAEARADVTYYDLTYLHRSRQPYAHKGDCRTQKSNALKPADEKNARRSPWIAPAAARRTVAPTQTARGLGIPNPNKGASRTKILGLPTDWYQHLTLQRWRLHAHLIQHFFACPHCKQRAVKLFLPLCTEAELRDAGFARLWLDSHTVRIARSITLRPQAAYLVQRYGPLFPPRRMLCRKCLGVRYGDVRPR